MFPLTFLSVILICYGVLYAYPSNGAVYAATMIANACAASWFPMMWPWRVQTTSRATGSAFSIGFVNSYGQIGGAIGPQIFRESFSPRYTQAFGVCMGIVSCCICEYFFAYSNRWRLLLIIPTSISDHISNVVGN